MKLAETNGTLKLSEVAKIAIDLSAKIRDYWNTELPKRLRDYPIIAPDEDRGPPPPEEAALEEYFTELPPEMIYQLLIIMHLGREDFEPAKLAEKYEQLKASFAKHELAIGFIMRKAAGSLPYHLTEGLEILKRNKINVDKFFAKAGKSRK